MCSINGLLQGQTDVSITCEHPSFCSLAVVEQFNDVLLLSRQPVVEIE